MKCVLTPTRCISFLGMLVDSILQAFLIPDNKEKFAQSRERLLSREKSVTLKLLQKMMGKCISFLWPFREQSFYIREMASAIRAANGKLHASFPPYLREELVFWRFLDSWKGHVPWRKEEHVALKLSTDASYSRWEAVVHMQSGNLTFRDFWEENIFHLNINVKEMYAVLNALESLQAEVHDCRLDIQVDNQAIMDTRHRRGSRSKDLNRVAQRIFTFSTERDIAVALSYVPSNLNEADWFSRRLTAKEAILSQKCWQIL